MPLVCTASTSFHILLLPPSLHASGVLFKGLGIRGWFVDCERARSPLECRRTSMVDSDSSSGGTRSGSSGRACTAPAAATSFATVSMDSAATSATELLTPGTGQAAFL